MARAPEPKPTDAKASAPALVPLGVLAGKAAISLSRTVTTVGARETNRLRLMSRTMSQNHALLVNSGNGTYVCDLASREGVLVNGVHVRHQQLTTGDRVQFGKFLFEYRGLPDAPPSLHADPPPGKIEMEDGPSLQIDEKILLIGRRANLDLPFTDDPAISTLHAIIFPIDGQWYLRDLSSRTGTKLNGKSIHQAKLEFGNQITVGKASMEFVAAPSAVPDITPGTPDSGESALSMDSILEEPLGADAALPIEDFGLDLEPKQIAEAATPPPPKEAPSTDEHLLPLAEDPPRRGWRSKLPKEALEPEPQPQAELPAPSAADLSDLVLKNDTPLELADADKNAPAEPETIAAAEAPAQADHEDLIPMADASLAAETDASEHTAEADLAAPDISVGNEAQAPANVEKADVAPLSDLELVEEPSVSQEAPRPAGHADEEPTIPMAGEETGTVEPELNLEDLVLDSEEPALPPPDFGRSGETAELDEPAIPAAEATGAAEPELNLEDLVLDSEEPTIPPPDFGPSGGTAELEEPTIPAAEGTEAAEPELNLEDLVLDSEEPTIAPPDFGPSDETPELVPEDAPSEATGTHEILEPAGAVDESTISPDSQETPIATAESADLVLSEDLEESAIALPDFSPEATAHETAEPPAAELPVIANEIAAASAPEAIEETPALAAVDDNDEFSLPTPDFAPAPIESSTSDDVVDLFEPELSGDEAPEVSSSESPDESQGAVISGAARPGSVSDEPAEAELPEVEEVDHAEAANAEPPTTPQTPAAEDQSELIEAQTKADLAGLMEVIDRSKAELDEAVETPESSGPAATLEEPLVVEWNLEPSDEAAPTPQPEAPVESEPIVSGTAEVPTEIPDFSSNLTVLSDGDETHTLSGDIHFGGVDEKSPAVEVLDHTDPTPESALDLEATEEIPLSSQDLVEDSTNLPSDTTFGRAVEEFTGPSTGPIVELSKPDADAHPAEAKSSDHSENENLAPAAATDPVATEPLKHLEDLQEFEEFVAVPEDVPLDEIDSLEDISLLEESPTAEIDGLIVGEPLTVEPGLTVTEPESSDAPEGATISMDEPALEELPELEEIALEPQTPTPAAEANEPPAAPPTPAAEAAAPPIVQVTADFSLPPPVALPPPFVPPALSSVAKVTTVETGLPPAIVPSPVEVSVTPAPALPPPFVQQALAAGAAKAPAVETSLPPAIVPVPVQTSMPPAPLPPPVVPQALAPSAPEAATKVTPPIFGFDFDGASFIGGMPLKLKDPPASFGKVTRTFDAKAGQLSQFCTMSGAAPSLPIAEQVRSTGPSFERAAGPSNAARLAQPPAKPPVSPAMPAPAPAARVAPPPPPAGRSLTNLASPQNPPSAIPTLADDVVVPPLARPSRQAAPVRKKLNTAFDGLTPTRGADVFSQTRAPISADSFGARLPEEFAGDEVTRSPMPQSFGAPLKVKVPAGGGIPPSGAARSNGQARPAHTKKPRLGVGVLLVLMFILVGGVWAGVYFYVPHFAKVTGKLGFPNLPQQPMADQQTLELAQISRLSGEDVRQIAKSILAGQGTSPGFLEDAVHFEDATGKNGKIQFNGQSLQVESQVADGTAGDAQMNALLLALSQKDADLVDTQARAAEAADAAKRNVERATIVLDDINDQMKKLGAAGDQRPDPNEMAKQDDDAAQKTKLSEAAKAARVELQLQWDALRQLDTSKPIDPDTDSQLVQIRKQMTDLKSQIADLKGGASNQGGADGNTELIKQLQDQVDAAQTKLDERLAEVQVDQKLSPQQREVNRQKAVEDLTIKLAQLQSKEADAVAAANAANAVAAQTRQKLEAARLAQSTMDELPRRKDAAEADLKAKSDEQDAKQKALAACVVPAGTPQVSVVEMQDQRPILAGIGSGVIVLIFSYFIILAAKASSKITVAVPVAPIAAPPELTPSSAGNGDAKSEAPDNEDIQQDHETLPV